MTCRGRLWATKWMKVGRCLQKWWLGFKITHQNPHIEQVCSRGRNPCCCLSCSVVTDSERPWTIAPQGPLPTWFSRQEYWSGLPFPFSEALPDPGFEPRSPAWQAESLPSEPSEAQFCAKLPQTLLCSLSARAHTSPALRGGSSRKGNRRDKDLTLEEELEKTVGWI